MRSSSLRVLTIAHNAVAASNRARFDALRQVPGLQVSLLTPAWWFEEGRRIDVSRSATWRVGRTLFTGNGTRYVYLTGLMNAVRETRPDVIDLHEEPFSFVALQAMVIRDVFAPRAALVFYSAVNIERRWRWPYRAIERLLLRKADGAHAPNPDVPRILRAKGMLQQPISLIPLGVELERFAQAEPLVLADIPPPRVGFVGRLEPVKGLDVLLDAFGRLQAHASLVIVGDGSEAPRVQRAAASNPRIHMRAPVGFGDVPSLLKAFDLLVLPSVTIPPFHREQFGRVLVEAMASGVPVVGSSSGAIPEVIGDAGLVVPEGDAGSLAKAIDAILHDESLRQRLVDRGLQRARARFAWTMIAEQTGDLFRAALAHRRGIPQVQAVSA